MSDTKKEEYNLLSNKSQLTRKIQIHMSLIGDNIMQLLRKKLTLDLEGKCSIEGYVLPNSIEVITYSSGSLVKSNVEFTTVFECSIINPVEGMLINAVAENITKAGIKAKVPGEYSPLVIFIARDHNYSNQKFNNIKENDEILVKVIGQRFELNDTYISVIGEVVEKKIEKKKRSTKPKLILKD
tara:strand:- start:3938 stop:4489 length:552 start_codon:yes stop_codon:yes gene_type:complete